MKIISDNWIKVILILSIFAISTALIAEHFFNINPCKMCLNQRYPYYFIIAAIIIYYLIKKNFTIFFSVLFELAIFYGLFYSIWHVAIETGLLKGPAGCSISLEDSSSLENLKKQILEQQVISCEDINWVFFGISAASINTLLLLFFLIFNTIFIYKSYYAK